MCEREREKERRRMRERLMERERERDGERKRGMEREREKALKEAKQVESCLLYGLEPLCYGGLLLFFHDCPLLLGGCFDFILSLLNYVA